jgi:hypothetical protein
MDTSRFVRLAPLTGVAFFALALAGAVSTGNTPDFPGTPAEWVTFFTKNHQRVILGSWISGIAMFFLFWFLGTLAAAARRAEGGDGRVSRLAYGGGVAGATLFVGGLASVFMGGLRVDNGGGISDDVATVYGDLFSALGFLAAPVAFAVLLGGLAVVNSRTPFLPRWLTWVSGLIALVLLIAPIAFIGMLAFGIWCPVVGSLMFIQSTAEAAEA